jgi:hypothetical protein
VHGFPLAFYSRVWAPCLTRVFQLLSHDGRMDEASRLFFQQMKSQLLQEHDPWARDDNLPTHDHWHYDDGSGSD